MLAAFIVGLVVGFIVGAIIAVIGLGIIFKAPPFFN